MLLDNGRIKEVNERAKITIIPTAVDLIKPGYILKDSIRREIDRKEHLFGKRLSGLKLDTNP